MNRLWVYPLSPPHRRNASRQNPVVHLWLTLLIGIIIKDLPCTWGNFGLFCTFCTKLPLIHWGLHCNVMTKTQCEMGFRIVVYGSELQLSYVVLSSWHVFRINLVVSLKLGASSSCSVKAVERCGQFDFWLVCQTKHNLLLFYGQKFTSLWR